MKQENTGNGCRRCSTKTARKTNALIGFALALATLILLTAPTAQAAESPGAAYTAGDVTVSCTCSQCLPGAECDRDRDGYVKTSGICGECPGCGYQADCNDNDSNIRPGAIEICDGKDNDCSLATADGFGESWHGQECDGADADICREGVFSCAGGNKTCTDRTNGTFEVCNGEDDDCDGLFDENLTYDADGDGYTSPNSCEGSQDDCNDGNRTVNPGAQEACNGLDDNCDGQADEDLTFDDDGDGFTSPNSCQGTRDDCDDQDPDAHPGAEEICNGLDDDCDGQADEGLTFDADQDGYTSPESCQGTRDDCDDGNAAVHPGAAEVCNGVDDDCDGGEDEGGDRLCDSLDRYDGWTHYCDVDAHARHMLFHDFSCEGTGGCVEDTYYTNESIVEDCGGKGGVMNDCGLLGWSCSEEFNGVHCLISDIQPDDSRCQTVCSADTLRHGVCIEGIYRCGFEDEDCNQYNSGYCNGTSLYSVDYTCGQGTCVVQDTTSEDCDNGLWCDGAETCSYGECMEGSPTDCSDSVSCTEDSCDEAADACRHAADDSLCDEPGDCRDAVCDPVSGCELTIDTGYVFIPPTCGQGECVSQYYCDIEDGDACVPLTPRPESCDSLDNDCDGQADEDYPNLGGACTAGTGACQDEGVYVCAGNGTVCDATAGTPTTESCGNGVDDDCDGKTDCQDQDCIGAEECFFERPCGDGLDLCEWSETLPLGSEDKSSCNLMYNTVWPSPSDRTVTCLFDGTENANHTFYFTVDNDVVSCTLNGNAVIGGVLHEGCAVQDPRSANAYRINASAGANTLTCIIRDRHVQSFFDACVVGSGVRCPDIDGDGFKDVACGGNDCDDDNDAAYPGATESCNGADDDCDGSTDETFTNKGQGCTAGQGVCQDNGIYVCAANGLSTVCDAVEGAPTGADDDCNGLDEDCSGTADDNYVATATSCGTGVCAREGQNICTAGRIQDTCAPGNPTGADTNCNGLDEDCDGTVDEHYVATPTYCGTGACAATGQLVCIAGGTQDTCQTGTPAAEACNGLDDDCDGQADEGLTFDADQDGYSTAASCNGTRNDCDDANPAVYPGAAEVCNGADDDCDSQIDETFTNKGQTCTSGQGVCQENGIYVCAANGLSTVCSAVAGTPGTEVCDGGQLDEDCDGTSNEGCNCVNGATQSCYGGPEGTSGVGACHGGTQTCAGGNWGTCTGQVTPITESCNGVDDDCDGQTDESLGSTSCGLGSCAHTVQNCVGGQTQTCDAFQGASAESCNGLDDDCDGSTDETFTNKGQGCTTGAGVCQESGTYVCSQDGQATVCDAVAGNQTGADDDCDGLDDDCDGTADDNYASTETSCGQGVCSSAGHLVCVSGQLQDTCAPSAPTGADDDCDGLDDDCDGSSDDGYQPAATYCGIGVCAAEGLTSCAGGQVRDSCVAGAPTGEDADCNGLDEDCSGTADDNFLPTVSSCGTGVCASSGLNVCVSGSVEDTCEAANQTGSDDDCDGVDENCNGVADDNYQPTPTSCGRGVCSAAGQLICIGGQTQDTCAPTQPTGLDDNCNGLDEDCSGTADNNYVPAGTTCGTGICESSGQLTCAFGQTTDSCLAGAPLNETCNGLDDDCDGTTDEGCECIDGATQPCYTGCGCTEGFGACHGGTQTCVSGLWGACTGEVTPVTEYCNGLDDDCDGHTDEFLGSTTCGQGACLHTVENCVFGQAQTCDPMQGASAELCDGVDNDCDGLTDEDYIGLGQACTAGYGVCQAAGTTVCAANGLSTACSATLGNATGSDDDCDGVDDDCDGTADDNYVANQTGCGIGACGRTGLLMCVGGQTQDTCQAGAPSNESCNGADDDCNGMSDETYNVGASCSVGVGQCASAGYMVCLEGGAACDAVAGTPSNESCDGFDNDCDGTVDEGCECIDGATQACYDGAGGTMGVGVCKGGTQTCVSGLWGACSGDVLPAQESCNGLDDDCDGRADEGIPCGSGGGGGGGPGYEITNREYRIETEDRFPVSTTLPAPTTTLEPVTTTTLGETGSERNPVESAGLVCPPAGGTASLLSETPVCEPAAEAPRVTGFAIWPGELMGLTGAWYARNFLILLILAAGYYVYAKDNERLMKANKAGGQPAQ